MVKINWERVRHIMEKSIRGGGLTEEESDAITTAWCRAPDEYRRLHNEVREEAQKEMMQVGRSRAVH